MSCPTLPPLVGGDWGEGVNAYLFCIPALMNGHSGFTLLELIVTLALAAIVLTLGVPSLQEWIRNNRFLTDVDALVVALQLTRSEAVKRGVRVTLYKSANGTSCAHDGGYEQGWIVFVDPNNNATVDADEEVIHAFEAIAAGTGTTLTGNQPVAKYVSYTADGVARLTSGAFQAGTLTACMPPKARRIVINRAGRVKVLEATYS